jgi:hypothetical protein
MMAITAKKTSACLAQVAGGALVVVVDEHSEYTTSSLAGISRMVPQIIGLWRHGCTYDWSCITSGPFSPFRRIQALGEKHIREPIFLTRGIEPT